jgi:hypothetical protein
MDIYGSLFVGGRRRDCLNERSVPGTQVFFIYVVSCGTCPYGQENCHDGEEFLHADVSAFSGVTRVTDVVEAWVITQW